MMEKACGGRKIAAAVVPVVELTEAEARSIERMGVPRERLPEVAAIVNRYLQAVQIAPNFPTKAVQRAEVEQGEALAAGLAAWFENTSMTTLDLVAEKAGGMPQAFIAPLAKLRAALAAARVDVEEMETFRPGDMPGRSLGGKALDLMIACGIDPHGKAGLEALVRELLSIAERHGAPHHSDHAARNIARASIAGKS